MNGSRFDVLTRNFASVSNPRGGMRAGSPGLTTAGFSSARAQGATPVGTNEGSLLFVQNAGATTLEPAGDGTYTLTMNDVLPQTLYFSDRPARIAGTIPTEGFVTGWEEAFADSPPNASLIAHSGENAEDEDAVVVELLDSTYDAAAGSLTYTVRILAEDEIGGRTYEHEPLTSLDATREYTEAHLFIDNLAQCIFC